MCDRVCTDDERKEENHAYAQAIDKPACIFRRIRKIDGDAKIQAPGTALSQLDPSEFAEFTRVSAKMNIGAPTIELFHAFSVVASQTMQTRRATRRQEVCLRSPA